METPSLGVMLDSSIVIEAERQHLQMPVTISDEVLVAAHISESELKQELAVTLFWQERLTLAQASHLAEMSQLAFQALLAERQIPIHYGIEEFREDLRTNPRSSS